MSTVKKKKEKEKEKLLIFERSYVYAISFIFAWSVQIAVMAVFFFALLITPAGLYVHTNWVATSFRVR